MVISEPTLKRDITNTFIPRGDENEYTNTLKPIPTLHRVVQDTTSESIMHYEIESPDDRTTITTSAPSVDALPNFQFPVVNDPLSFQNQHLLSKELQPLIVIESILKKIWENQTWHQL